VSGIGPKTAKLIVVTLAGKLVAPAGSAAADASRAPAVVTTSLVAALTGLGWPERTALDVAAQVVDADPDASTTALSVLLRRALAQLGPARARSAADSADGSRS
jgi:holliday junction DNA helicase RuvA